MFSFRPTFLRRVVAGINIGSFRRCIQTNGFPSVWVKRTSCHVDLTLNDGVTRTFATKAQPVSCWKCQKESNNMIFCEHCSALQKPDSDISYFDLFDLKESFDTDPVELSVKYRKLQSFLHPDKFANASEAEKENSAEFSSLINKAYQTLILPLSRGMYLLELKGINTSQEDETSDDKEFLMEVMIRNEELEEAESEVDIKAFHKEVKATLGELIQEVSDAFKKDNIIKAHAALIRMRYFTSILDKVKTKIRERGIVE